MESRKQETAVWCMKNLEGAWLFVVGGGVHKQKKK